VIPVRRRIEGLASLALLFAALVVVLPARGQEADSAAGEIKIAETLTMEKLECLPSNENRSVDITAQQLPPSVTVQLFFRRLHPEGSFYYVKGVPSGLDQLWAALPKPEDKNQQELTDEWWEVVKTRDWMQYRGRNREWLENWLGEQDHEAAEVFAALVDADGRMLERSEVQLVQVRNSTDCPEELDPKQQGEAGNLTVGETNSLQEDRGLFHWLCDGVVSRISIGGVLDADTACRHCIAGEG